MRERTEVPRLHVKSVSLIGVQTDAYDEMVRFYREVMGLDVDYEGEDLTEFILPNRDVLVVYGPKYKDERPYRTGPVPAFFVEDVPAARAEMEAAGVGFVGSTDTWDGWWYALFRAPDGNLYRIMTRPEAD